MDYVIKLQSDVEIGNQKKDGKYSSLALPSKAGTLIIIGNGHKLRFAGNISLKSNLVLQNMELCPVKTVKNEVVPTKAHWGNLNWPWIRYIRLMRKEIRWLERSAVPLQVRC